MYMIRSAWLLWLARQCSVRCKQGEIHTYSYTPAVRRREGGREGGREVVVETTSHVHQLSLMEWLMKQA
jgi:hypothetical protein